MLFYRASRTRNRLYFLINWLAIILISWGKVKPGDTGDFEAVVDFTPFRFEIPIWDFVADSHSSDHHLWQFRPQITRLGHIWGFGHLGAGVDENSSRCEIARVPHSGARKCPRKTETPHLDGKNRVIMDASPHRSATKSLSRRDLRP